MPLEIKVESTPNPNAIKFTATQPLFEGSTSLKKGDITDHPLASALLSIEGVDNIFGINDFVTVNKTLDANWDELIPQVQQAFDEVYK